MALDPGDELLCVVFTDLVGWTEMGDRIGDDAADAVRRQHFAVIRQALDASGAGHGGVVALVGEAGVGRTRLTREMSTSRGAAA